MRPPRSGTLRPPRMDDLETWRICGVLLPASARTLDFHHPEGWACCVRSSKGVRGGPPRSLSGIPGSIRKEMSPPALCRTIHRSNQTFLYAILSPEIMTHSKIKEEVWDIEEKISGLRSFSLQCFYCSFARIFLSGRGSQT